jgi:Ala-tRNA(Pro) deacylase
MAVDIYQFLGAQDIPYERFDHPPVFTCEESHAYVSHLPGVPTKNLFLRDKKGSQHVLVVTTHDKSVDLRQLAEMLGLQKLSFGSEERLLRHLGVKKGAVTLLGLVNDTKAAVALVVDQDIDRAEAVQCHPLVNDATVVIAQEGIRRFFQATGHPPRVLKLPVFCPEG